MATKTVATHRSYFLTYLLPTAYTETELNTFKEQVANLVVKHQGKITQTEEWGKRKMAYKIKHGGKLHSEAHYIHLTVDLVATEAQSLEKDLYLNQVVIRHLFVIAEEQKAE